MMVTLQEKEELTLVWHPPENATGTVRFLWVTFTTTTTTTNFPSHA